jgi:predicted nucleotidyltransferase
MQHFSNTKAKQSKTKQKTKKKTICLIQIASTSGTIIKRKEKKQQLNHRNWNKPDTAITALFRNKEQNIPFKSGDYFDKVVYHWLLFCLCRNFKDANHTIKS